MTPSMTRCAELLSACQPEMIDQLGDFYAEDATLIDPINHATGLDQIKLVWEDLFKQLKDIHFDILRSEGGEQHAFFEWKMSYRFRGKDRSIPGVSHFIFSEAGLIQSQRDYWDASDVVYGEFPGLGLAIRGIRKMVRVSP